MTDTEMFLSRAECQHLVDHLREIADLIEPLRLAISRQDRNGLSDTTTRRAPQSKPPLDLAAWSMAEDLHNLLGGWVRIICEQRGLPAPGVDRITAAARWLDRNVIAFAMTEGALDGYTAIVDSVRAIQERLNRPGDGQLTDEELAGANRQVLTAYQIDRVLHLLGDRGEGLNRRRVEILARAGVLKPCDRDRDTGKAFFRLGDILAAHQIHPRRERGSKA